MHILRLTMGLLIALAVTNVAAAQETQQGDKSYLPPSSLRASPGAATAHAPQRTSIGPRRSANAVRRHREPRPHRGRRLAAPRFFFGIF
jgi:hypothetical protein